MAHTRTVLAISLVAIGLFSGSPAAAQSAEDLATGRKLFAEALADEDKKHFAAALEKYKRVQTIKDTVAVRFRIGAAYEGLGQLARAVDAYTAAVRLGTSNASDADIVRGAQERIGILEPKVAHLSLHLPRGSFTDAEVSVDDEAVSTEALADVRVDPGTHVVAAKATGAQPFRAQITLSEGGRAELPIVFESTRPPDPPPPPPPPPSSALTTIGIVTTIGGVVLVAGGVVALVVRSNAITDLKDSCRSTGSGTLNCPLSQQDELQSAQDRASAMGPLGGALLGVGGAAVATGVVLYLLGKKETAAAASFVPVREGGVLQFRGTF